MEHITVSIQILHVRLLDMCLRITVCRAECSFRNAAVDDVSELGSNERSTLTGLNVLELYYLTYLAVDLECHTISEFTC